MEPKIAFGITTFLRDNLMKGCVTSALETVPNNSVIIVADQGHKTGDKAQWEAKHSAVKYYSLPFDCGLSSARNFIVNKAKELGCDYLVMGADSIFFNESMRYANIIVRCLQDGNFDLIGFDLKNRIPWEAWIELIPGECFELDYLRKKTGEFNERPDYKPYVRDNNTCVVYPVELVKNFFIAKVDSLIEVPWDEDLKLFEHEDFFWRFKEAGKKVGWTQFCSGSYVDEKPPEYKRYRDRMYHEFKKILQKKYGITGWLRYKNYR